MDMIVPMHPLTFFDDGELLNDVLLYFDAPMIVESSYALEIKAAEYNPQWWINRYYWIILLLWMIVDEVLILLFKYMPMVQLLFNALCTLQNELIFVVSNLFIGKRFSLKCGRVSDPAH